jgi:hypothetical protein
MSTNHEFLNWFMLSEKYYPYIQYDFVDIDLLIVFPITLDGIYYVYL